MASRCLTPHLLKLVILSVTALGLIIDSTESRSMIPFGANYAASTDALHTRVVGGGSRVDLVLDRSSGEGMILLVFRCVLLNVHASCLCSRGSINTCKCTVFFF